MDALHAAKDKITPDSTAPSASAPPAELDGTRKPRRLLVAAGPSYATHSHIPVPVNSSTPVLINSPSMLVLLHVRIRSFHGLPSSTSQETSEYFADPSRSRDLYSLSFSFIPKRDIESTSLVWGNDFDYPVRKYLPPGFNLAFRIVKEFVDPGLTCDAYADNPWILGPALSCWFAFSIRDKVGNVPACEADAKEKAQVPEWAGEEEHEEKKRNRVSILSKTGATYAGPVADAETVKAWLALFANMDDTIALKEGDSDPALRTQLGIPAEAQKRRRHFLKEENRQKVVFEKGRLYAADFFNPHIDFDQGKLKLPGFSLQVLRWVGDKTHTLRYVLKDKDTGELMFCCTLSMLFGDDVQRGERAEGSASDDSAKRGEVK